MRTYTVTQREGELLGPIDWSYNFLPHFDCWCVPVERKIEALYEHVERLYQVERLCAKGQRVEVCTRDYWHPVIAIGMYDGWPYWRPVPSILVQGPLGAQWEQFPCVDAYRVKRLLCGS
jgi:hypothetical protein